MEVPPMSNQELLLALDGCLLEAVLLYSRRTRRCFKVSMVVVMDFVEM